jgi:hypothetical protein
VNLRPESLAGRVVAIGLPLVTAFTIAVGLIAPIGNAFLGRIDDITHGEKLVQEFSRRAAPLQNLREAVSSAEAAMPTVKGYLPIQDLGAASNFLQTRVRRTLQESGGSLRSLQVLPVTKDGAVQKVTLRIDATLPMQKLTGFLHALTSSEAYVFWDNVGFRAPDTRGKEPTPSTPITLRADVYSYFRAP